MDRTCHGGRANVHPKADALGELTLILIANVLVALVAALHVFFLVLEMFLWDKPLGLKVFRNSPEKAEITRMLAANQGLYNGFLAAGLVWGLFHGNPAFAFQIKVFFLLCVIVAGAYGAATVSTRILILQALPAAIALIAMFLA
ncbi:membrane protein [Bradyrhizobium sp. CCBAU 45321]|nr:membrane protein [Bradyrhizobium sp. CCBAU 45321]